MSSHLGFFQNPAPHRVKDGVIRHFLISNATKPRAGINARTGVELRIQHRAPHSVDGENSGDDRNNVRHKVSVEKICAGSMKAKEHAQVASISVLIGCVSVGRATAVYDAISVNPQMLKTVKEISAKLEKRLRRNLNDSSRKPEHFSDKFHRHSFHLHIETYVALFPLTVEAMTSEREREAKSALQKPSKGCYTWRSLAQPCSRSAQLPDAFPPSRTPTVHLRA